VWRNRVEHWRAFLDVPRQLQSLGEGGDVQVMAFRGVDLVGAGDITIARGTNTMMPRSAKTALAREELQMAMQTGDTLGALRYQRAVTGNTGPLLGLQDDPHRARVMRQILEWQEAAKAQHEAAPEPELDPMTGQPAVDPMTGAPMQTPDPVASEAGTIFAPNPTDDLPMVAPIRFAELSDVVASRAFLTADPRYQQALYVEYERMRAAAGVQTRAEQAQAAQAQQAQQQAMQMEQIQSKNAEQAAKTAYAESEGGPSAQRMAMQDAAQQGLRADPSSQGL
jgi:hypothetical protein